MGDAVRLPVFENECRTPSIHLRRGTFGLGVGESGEYFVNTKHTRIYILRRIEFVLRNVANNSRTYVYNYRT